MAIELAPQTLFGVVKVEHLEPFKPDDVIRAAERIEQILHDHGTLPARPPEPADAEDDTELDGQA